MSPSFWTSYLLALAIVGLMLAGLYIIVRGLARGRILAASGRRFVNVVESTMLSQHVAMHVVRAGSRYLLVGGANNGALTTLAELTPEEVEAWLAQQRESMGAAPSLGALVARVRGGGRNP